MTHAAAPAAPLADEGRTERLGATPRDDGDGVDFVVWSDSATAIDLCLFDADGSAGSERRVRLRGPDAGVFHGHLRDAAPGQVYGLRAHGPYAPSAGHRHNPHKLLLDPYAREIVGRFEHRPEHHGYVLGGATDSFDSRDNAATALKARVAARRTAVPAGELPRIARADVVLLELHVKGWSQQHPAIPEALRGTYAALGHPTAIDEFRRLGVTTLSLLPVHFHLDEPLIAEGLVNHWGYNTLGFFCPDPRFATRSDDPTAVANEFRAMVAALHAAGLEVVLDVVYNHTAEGNHAGPTLSMRGLDQRAWYRVGRGGAMDDVTGCGNTVQVAHPQVTRFVLDSLRYWVEVMGVDGFRFDLAAALGRGADGRFDRHAAFFTALAQDPVLARVHLIAEPWDAGPQGYRVGDFPGRWTEWNDRWRDAVRGFWLGADGGAASGRDDFAAAFAASPAVYRRHQRPPTASVNFVAVHDGYTLADVVAYAGKHNEANGEGNRDGRDDELSANFGVEGPTDDPAIRETRRRVVRAMLATLAFSHGTPMLLAGAETGNTQHGNNNAWNQDNATGWVDRPGADPALADFVASLLAIRREQPALRPARWADASLRWIGGGAGVGPLGSAEAAGTDGAPLACIATLGDGARAGRHAPAPLLIVFAPSPDASTLPLPAGRWRVRVDSSGEHAAGALFDGTLPVPARSLTLLQRDDGGRAADDPAEGEGVGAGD